MPSVLNPYISFNQNAREAMTFYQTVFGGKLVMQTFGEGHATQDPAAMNLIMHAQLIADNGIMFMAADTPPGMDFQPGAMIRMSLGGDDAAELKGYFEKLADGATILAPLEQAPWGDTFGMLIDRFGVMWFVNILAPKV